MLQGLSMHLWGDEMEYISVTEAASKWGLSRRRVLTLCAEDRIPGVSRLGSIWMIPKDAEKPADARIKSGKYIGASGKHAQDPQPKHSGGSRNA